MRRWPTAVATLVALLAGAAWVRPLPFFYDLYTFRGEDGTTDVVASFVVPAGRLDRQRSGPFVRYGFDVSLVLSDTARRTVVRTDDSVVVRLPRPLSGDHLLNTFVQVAVPPSGHVQQRVIVTDATTPGVGQLYRSPFPIPDYSGSHLMISDLALGLPDAGSGWTRGGVTLALLPTSQFPASSFDVFYEVYNLPAGTPYDTELTIERLDEDGGVDDEAPAVRATFSGVSTAGADDALGELRRVDTSLPKGRYRLTVAVANRTNGEAARRSREFRVRGWKRGVSLIPALPWRRSETSPGAG